MGKGYLIIIFSIFCLCSCIEEIDPRGNTVTPGQIGNSPAALEALSQAASTYMYAFQQIGIESKQEYGYPAQMRIKDCLLADYPSTNTGFEYMRSPWCSLSSNLAQGNPITAVWRFYYSLIFNVHNLIVAIDEETAEEKSLIYLGNAFLYRALAYMDLTRMYEYKRTGIPSLDAEADREGLWGLTVPLVTEKTTGEDALNNPRRMFYEMYRFILTDLNKAEHYLQDYTRTKKNHADLITVYAYKARFWLELATRFRTSPEDLSTALAHEQDPALSDLDKLGIPGARECYEKAAGYSRKVIESGYTPLNRNEWHSTENGFNSSSSRSWIFAVIIPGPEAVKHAFYSFIGQMSPEYDQGVGTSTYNTVMISKALFDKIEDADWRKSTWIAPEDAGKVPDRDKYSTTLTDEQWSRVKPYGNFKFRPRDGNRSDYRTGGAIDLPLFRVEEAYFIEIEATAYTQGLDEAVKKLESFINTYRYSDGSYKCNASDVPGFVNDHLMLHKRIEFWGEGILFYDYKRLNLPIERGYPGTNYPTAQRYNWNTGYCAPWLNCYFPRSGEVNKNKGMKQNPNPNVKDNVGLWVEK